MSASEGHLSTGDAALEEFIAAVKAALREELAKQSTDAPDTRGSG